jgi:class 3 adenylate cyclase
LLLASRAKAAVKVMSKAFTFLFIDIEGSTRLVKALRERYPQVLAEHRRLVRAAIAAHGGREVDTQGDGFFAAFGGATQAVLCAPDIQRALAAHRWPGGAQVRVRIGIHTGQAVPDGGLHRPGGAPGGADLRRRRRGPGADVPGDADADRG